MSLRWDEKTEWLEADGLGGFASGTVTGVRTRRYHACLLVATTPPTGRCVLVNGFDAWVETAAGTFPISSQRYAPDIVHPDGAARIIAFDPDPWPRWRFRLDDGTEIDQEIFAREGVSLLSWELAGGPSEAKLHVRPFLSGRDYHTLHRENPAFRFEPERREGYLVWRPYNEVPAIVVAANGEYRHEPVWYRNFLYAEERDRGLDCAEDLAAPGVLRFDLGHGRAVLVLEAEADASDAPGALGPPGDPQALETWFAERRGAEDRRRRRFPSRLERAADAYIVVRGEGKTIVAGYPWFTDWGRDTFISMRGLCLATGRLEDAREILLEWSDEVSEGMLPNRFTDRNEPPEFNSVDASLWYVIAVHEFFRAVAAREQPIPVTDRQRLREASEAILEGYWRGTRYGIRADPDGLLAAGEAGVQLTWMDAKVGDWVVTPRIGKPVEVQALWLNALWAASGFSKRWEEAFVRARETFRTRFWNEDGGYLYDVVDCGHHPGTADPSLRPNQIFAVGGLPVALLAGERARRVVDTVEAELLTPLGLRSLAPGSPGYRARYEGGVVERDGAYHQGTVWPWLLGPFVDAWVRVRGSTPDAKREARARFLEPLLRHLNEAGLGHISEIADAEAPHTARGCPFQAWSVGEALRLARMVLVDG